MALLDDDPRARGRIDAVDAGYMEWFKYPGNVLQNRSTSPLPVAVASGVREIGGGHTAIIAGEPGSNAIHLVQ